MNTNNCNSIKRIPGWILLIGLLGTVSILAQPSNLNVIPTTLSVSIGASATFRVRASGAAPFTFQWWVTNVAGAGPISGVENPSALANILNLTNAVRHN